MRNKKLIGPFSQLLPMTGLALKGPLPDTQLQVVKNAGILMENEIILEVGAFAALRAQHQDVELVELEGNHVCLPGFIDAHTHICFAGSRAGDYALRNSGKTYLEIAKAGGGIWDTVAHTRKATESELIKKTTKRTKQHLLSGVTTIEVKSGYGLNVAEEIKLLRVIKQTNAQIDIDLIPTCLAAHICPRDFEGHPEEYLTLLSTKLFPILQREHLTNRIDAFIDEGAFSPDQIAPYFRTAKKMGFDLTVHADQFTTGGSALAVEFGAVSADHLEASGPKEIALMANSNTVATALPGATLGLGCNFTPARKILDAGGILAIASDHNPGSAPMGDLLAQAAIIGAFEKLSNTEVLAAITIRAAKALNLSDRGSLQKNMLADFSLFHTDDYREILYHQGSFKPCMVWKKGTKIFDKHH